MIKILLMTIGMIFIAIYPISVSADMTASQLFAYCSQKGKGSSLTDPNEAYCYGYINGAIGQYRIISDAADFLKQPLPQEIRFCLPTEGLSVEQARDLFVASFAKMSDPQSLSAGVAVSRTLRSHFPCKK